MSTTTKFTPGELGKRCAQSITADQFEPLIRQVSENLYEQFLGAVQDYLCQNAEWNISQRIQVAERSAQQAWQTANLMQAEFALLRGNLSNMLATFGSSESLSPDQSRACKAARAALAKVEAPRG